MGLASQAKGVQMSLIFSAIVKQDREGSSGTLNKKWLINVGNTDVTWRNKRLDVQKPNTEYY